LDLPLRVVTITVAHPQAADLEQCLNLIAQRLFDLSHSRSKSDPEVVRHSEVINTNSVAQAFDQTREQIQPLSNVVGHQSRAASKPRRLSPELVCMTAIAFSGLANPATN
jgi:hypothetical protein